MGMAAPTNTLTSETVVGSVSIDRELALEQPAADLDGSQYGPCALSKTALPTARSERDRPCGFRVLS